MLLFGQMDPDSAPPQLQYMQEQINQAMLEHQIVVQALRAVCLVSCLCVLALSLLSFWMWRRSVSSAQALIEQTKQHYIERSRQEARHSVELSEQRKEAAMALESISKMTWREFAEVVLRTSTGSHGGSG